MDNANDKDENGDGLLAKVLETVSPTEEEDNTAVAFNVSIDESLEKNRKNPLLFIPVIRNVLTFLNMNDIKNCRLVSRDWGSTGKVELASRALIHFRKSRPGRLPVDFRSCFLDSTTLFGAFEISSDFLKHLSDSNAMTEELTKFFNDQQKYLKELTVKFEYSNKSAVKNMDLTSWISKSPIVQNDAKRQTKLSVQGLGKILDIDIPLDLNLIAHIKDLTLFNCRLRFEAGIKICPVKLKLSHVEFSQDGNKLDRVQINDIVDLRKAKEVSLSCGGIGTTKYVLDLWGEKTLDNLDLNGVDIENGETSQWVIKHLKTNRIPYFLNNQMKIEELSLGYTGTIDLFTLPTSIQKLTLTPHPGNATPIVCSQPTVFHKLQYLHICGSLYLDDYSFLSHFMNCPQLTVLKLNGCTDIKIDSLSMPKSVKTLALQNAKLNWADKSDLKLETLVLYDRCAEVAFELCSPKIQVDDIVMLNFGLVVNKYLFANFLEYRKKFTFGKRIFVFNPFLSIERPGNSAFKAYVDVESLFYVFEKEEKGRAISEKEFYELVPKQLGIQEHLEPFPKSLLPK